MKAQKFKLWEKVYWLDRPYFVVAASASSSSEDYEVIYNISDDPPHPCHAGGRNSVVNVEQDKLMTPEEWRVDRVKRIEAELKQLRAQ